MAGVISKLREVAKVRIGEREVEQRRYTLAGTGVVLAVPAPGRSGRRDPVRNSRDRHLPISINGLGQQCRRELRMVSGEPLRAATDPPRIGGPWRLTLAVIQTYDSNERLIM